MTFAERLRQLREEKDMTLEEIGNILGVGRATIYKYEHGIITNVPPDKVHQLADLFGVTRPYMMGWTDNRRINPEENLDTVAVNMRRPAGEIVTENNTTYWRALPGEKTPDCTTAATQAARALIKFKVSRTPIYPQQILQASQLTTMISFQQHKELDQIADNCRLISYRKENDLVMSSIYTDANGDEKYLFAVNRNAPMGHLKLALAVELGHVYLGHASRQRNTSVKNKEAECFAIHLEFPRALIKLLRERGFVMTKETFSRIFGDCEWCLDSILNARPVRISPELNMIVKEQFTPYVNTLEEMGILSMPHSGEVLDLSKYMSGYED